MVKEETTLSSILITSEISFNILAILNVSDVVKGSFATSFGDKYGIINAHLQEL